MNAELVAKKGVGMWVQKWGWGHKCLVKGQAVALGEGCINNL